MQCTLFIPQLFWHAQTADAVLGGLALSALARLLARARAARYSAVTSEGWLCQAHEVERQQDWPVAPLTLELDGIEPGDAYWLRADPVHLNVDRDRLLLVEGALLDIDAEEAQAYVAALNAHFSSEGVTFHAPSPTRWYAKLARAPRLATHSTNEVAGNDVQRFLPSGADAMHWHRFYNEAQMLLHMVEPNVARDARGDPPVNSVWLWGGGTRPAVHSRPFETVWSDEALATALAVAAGAEAIALPADANAWLEHAGVRPRGEPHLLVIDELTSPAAHGDTEIWRTRVAELERRWFAPLLTALKETRISELVLVVPANSGCWRFELNRRDLLKFWRTARAWSSYA